MDFAKLAAQLVRERRGNRTQKSLSRALGFKSNVLFAWENEHDEPSARNFFRLVQKTGTNKDLSLFTRSLTFDLTCKKGIAEFLRHLAGPRKLSELTEQLGRDRHAVSRWLRGQTEIPLADFLNFVEVTTLGIFDFLQAFVDPSKLDEARLPFERLQRAREAARSLPWAHAIVHMADLPSYRALNKHHSGWFASRLGISTQEEEACLAHLVESGQLALECDRYRRVEALNVDTRPDPTGSRRIASFWLEEGSRRVQKPGSGRVSFNTFAVSEKDLEKIKELQSEYFRKLRSIVAHSEPTEAVAVASFQLLTLCSESQSDQKP